MPTTLDDGGAAGAIEAAPHNLVHKTIGLQGDMGSPTTAARDPIFWLHHANIDRLWVKWTDPARGRIPPVDDDVWMTTKFTFVDEDGNEQTMSGAEVLDTQFQLGYRYDDDPVRTQRLRLEVPVALNAPGAPSTAVKGPARGSPLAAPVVLARSPAVRLSAPDSQVALAPVSGDAPVVRSQDRCRTAAPARRAAQRDRARRRAAVRCIPGAGSSRHANAADLGPHRRARPVRQRGAGRPRQDQEPSVAIIALEASDALAELSRAPGFDPRYVRVSIVRRSFANASGGAFTPDDPDPPRIGSIELLQS